ncbi:MAG: aminomethyltransferase [Rubripirellula sp.]|nr:aminomethyltransferase [Rubripirellula sp.]
MTTPKLYRIDRLCVVDVGGQDADKIIHNLTTNEVKPLQPGEGRETFVTDVRGKTLAHLCLYRRPDELRMIGPAGPSDAIASHIDRYTILEDATAAIQDDNWVAFILPPDSDWAAQIQGVHDLPKSNQSSDPLPCGEWQWNEFVGSAYRTRWLGEGTNVLLVNRNVADSFAESAQASGVQVGDETEFHATRIQAGFPWHGIDLNEANLPQEADRDALAISFTKGCYLGQETVARLDALGQVQKKLVRWRIEQNVPPAGTELKSGDKVVGRLTSVTADATGAVAIGMARRSHFDAGSTAEGKMPDENQTFTATVL